MLMYGHMVAPCLWPTAYSPIALVMSSTSNIADSHSSRFEVKGGWAIESAIYFGGMYVMGGNGGGVQEEGAVTLSPGRWR